MHNSESVLEKETYKLLKDFVLQTDHQISARRPDLVFFLLLLLLLQKKTCRIVDFAILADHKVKLKKKEG